MSARSSKQRVNIASDSVWANLRGYSRAVRVGNTLFISGTTATNKEGDVIAPYDAYEQTQVVIAKVRNALEEAGFTLNDVVRTRLFVTNLAKWDDYARAHREAFERVRPASSIVEVSRLVDPRLMIEMEVDAVRSQDISDDEEH